MAKDVSPWRIKRVRHASGAYLHDHYPHKADREESKRLAELIVETLTANGYSGTLTTPVGEFVIKPKEGDE